MALKSFSNTKISMADTQQDLESLLIKHGIRASRWSHYAELGKEPGEVQFEFEWAKSVDKPPLGFRVSVEYKGIEGPRGGNQGTTREQAARALYWHVKNLFDAVDFGIVDIEQAFFPYLLLPDGRTAFEQAPTFLNALQTGEIPRLLTSGR